MYFTSQARWSGFANPELWKKRHFLFCYNLWGNEKNHIQGKWWQLKQRGNFWNSTRETAGRNLHRITDFERTSKVTEPTPFLVHFGQTAMSEDIGRGPREAAYHCTCWKLFLSGNPFHYFNEIVLSLHAAQQRACFLMELGLNWWRAFAPCWFSHAPSSLLWRRQQSLKTP